MPRRKTSYDPLFDEPQGNNWGRYALIAAIVVIVGFVLYATLAGPREGQGPVPLIRADETPWTRAPSEAGGMEIPNQDSTVFELMEAEKAQDAATAQPSTDESAETPADEKAEKTEDDAIKADAEKEKAKEDVKEEPKEVAKKEEAAKDKETLDKLVDDAMTPEDKAAAAKEPAEKAAPVIGETAKKETVKVEPKKEEPKPEPKPEDEPAPIKKDMVRVRLGAVPGTSTSEAQSEFNRLKGMSSGQLSGFSPSFETVNLPKGSFVRINVPMERMDAARLCDTLSAKGAPCLILSE